MSQPETQPKSVVESFFESKPELKEWREVLQVDFSDLDAGEDNVRNLTGILCVVLVMVVMVFAGTAWFISGNVSERRQAEQENRRFDAALSEHQPVAESANWLAGLEARADTRQER